MKRRRRMLFPLPVLLIMLGLLFGGTGPSALSSEGCCPSPQAQAVDLDCRARIAEITCCWAMPAQCPPPYRCLIVIDEFSPIFGSLCRAPEAPMERICTPAGPVGIALAAGDGLNNYYVTDTLIYLSPGTIELDLIGLCYGARRVEVVIEDTAGAGNTVVTALDAAGNVIDRAVSTTCLEEILAVDLCDGGRRGDYCGITYVKIEGLRTFVKEIRILL